VLHRQRVGGVEVLRPLAVALGLVVGATVFGFHSSARAQSGPSRVFDRTLLCTTLVQAGIRELDVYASSVVRGQLDYQGEKALPSASLGTGGPVSSGPGQPSAGGVTLVSGRAGPAREDGGSYFGVAGRHCKTSTRRVPLSPRGLEGGQASPLGSDRFECFPPRAILVRARAVFRSPTRLRIDRGSGFLSTSAPVREFAFAARTPSGKPLVYADVSDTGKARLFVARGCVAD
jgi:hypothetical protein